MRYMTGFQLFYAMQQLEFTGLTGPVSFNHEVRQNPTLEYYQLNDDGSYHFVGNFTNNTIYLQSSSLVFQSAGVPVSGKSIDSFLSNL